MNVWSLYWRSSNRRLEGRKVSTGRFSNGPDRTKGLNDVKSQGFEGTSESSKIKNIS